MTPLTPSSIEEAFASDATLQQAANNIGANIINGDYDILNFVEQLGFALTSTVLEKRVNGTKLLSDVLQQLPKDYLDRKQLEFLTNFYADRFNDQHSVLPAVINGIDALVEMINLPAECVPKILNSFFKHCHCQSQQRFERGKWFKILKNVAQQYETELKHMGADFMYGLISSIDGERDPRNLDFIFSFMPDLIQRFSLLHLGEEMFEIFACYFPIDFTPSREDPSNISRDKLAAKLSDCLVASPEFLEWLMPLALEKMESDLVVAKLDSLDLLRKSAIKFSPKSLSQHFDVIWTALKAEIFPGGDNADIVSAGHYALRTILEQAKSVPEISNSHQATVLGTILPHLGDVNQRLYNPSAAIALVCVAGDPVFASEKILNTFILKLNMKSATNMEATGDAVVLVTEDNYNEEQRIKVYMVIAQLFKISAIQDCLDKFNRITCNQIHEDIIAVLRYKLDSDAHEQNIDLKHAALSVLTESVPLISETNRALLYKVLLQLITHDTLDLQCTDFLELLGSLHPIEVKTNCIDIFTRNFILYPNFVKRKIFHHLLRLVVQAAFTYRVLDLVWHYSFAQYIPADVQLIALEALNTLLISDDSIIIELQTNNSLISKLADLALASPSLGIPALEQIAEAISRVEQHLSISEQYIISTEYLSQLKLVSVTHLYLAKGLLSRLHQDIILDDFLEWLLGDLTEQSLSCDQLGENKDKQRTVARHLLCSMVNRIEHNEQNIYNLTKIISLLKSKVKENNKEAVQTLAWIAKGLIVCGSEVAVEIINILTELLDHPILSSVAIVAFEIISTECNKLFLPKVKFLYKQKLFNIVFAKFGNKLDANSQAHLIALIFVLNSAPHAVQKMNIEKIGPLIFKSLEGSHTSMLCISLDICERFVAALDEYFLRHLNHIIPSCLKLSKYQNSMKVRVGALNLLHDITKYPTHVLLPYKIDVVLELATALDDHKRLVRNAAVRTRNTWYLVGVINNY